jgi:heme-degrading monooxygenase HmoA
VVILMTRYTIRPDKLAEYAAWAQTAIPAVLGAPGIVEFHGYRNLTGSSQVTTWTVFKDLAGFATWRSSEAVDKVATEQLQFVENFHIELLGPSPVMPEPLRPR